jgi:demethoxyubiquinone hydroxylase (CLK1/Coq7/Cat5 family)
MSVAPGSRDRRAGDRILKVNHAGEHGAVAIYGVQLLAVCVSGATEAVIWIGMLV